MKVLSIIALLVTLASGRNIQEDPFTVAYKAFVVPKSHEEFDSTFTISAQRGARIINGIQATDGQFPWTARLSIGVSGGGYLCSGSIISSNFALSARHCIADVDVISVQVSVGSVDRDSSEMTRVFSDFFWWLNAGDGDHPDIAILKLAQHLSFNWRVGSIRLPRRAQENEQFIGQPVQIIGWGGANDGLPRFLQFGNFRVDGTCNLRDFEICSRGDGATETRGGDSGGPVVLVESGTPTLIGVHAFRLTASGRSGSTRVSMFLSFINDVTGIPIRA